MTHRRLLPFLLFSSIAITSACADAVTSPDETQTRPTVAQPPSPPIHPPTEPPGQPPVTGAGPSIFFVSLDGSTPRPVTAGSWPAFSPDGQRLAFQNGGEVWVMNVNGDNKSRLAAGGYPSWSPDGKSIAFTNATGIALMNADGSNIRTLVRHDFRDDTYEPWDMGVSKASWSPDGRRIAFEHAGDGDMQPAQVFVVNVDGSGLMLLVNTGNGYRYAESDPAWSPDGKSIVLWSFGLGLAVVDVSSRRATSLFADFPGVAYGAKPTWSPDGDMIAFETGRFTRGAPEIWLMQANGSARRPFVGNAYHATWSPDRATLAFVRDR